jgi:hypothetical protein
VFKKVDLLLLKIGFGPVRRLEIFQWSILNKKLLYTAAVNYYLSCVYRTPDASVSKVRLLP